MRSSAIISIFLLSSAIALAQSGGTFTVTGDMTTARDGHTATLLNNGKVLIAGGEAGVDVSPPSCSRSGTRRRDNWFPQQRLLRKARSFRCTPPA